MASRAPHFPRDFTQVFYIGGEFEIFPNLKTYTGGELEVSINPKAYIKRRALNFSKSQSIYGV